MEYKKPLQVKLNKNDFDLSIQDVHNKTKEPDDKKNAKMFLVKITTQKISKKYALKLYSDLITSDITALEKSKSKGKDRRNWCLF